MTISYNAFKKISLLILFIIGLDVSASAEDDILNAHPAVWVIEQGDAKTYFLGSIHLLPKDISWFGGKIEEIFDDTDEVVFEVNMTEERQTEAQAITMQNGMFPAGENLGNYLSNEELEEVNNNAIGLGIPPQALYLMQPWIVSISLSINAIKKEGWDPDSGVDKYIKTKAEERNIKISELETLEEQMATLWDHPIDVQKNMLLDTLEQLKDIRNITIEMVGSWAEGDVKKMQENFLDPMKEQPEIFKKLVIDRNNNWIPVIERLIESNKNTLIVAGAAHFIGEEGVINLLKQKGYNVKRVQ